MKSVNPAIITKKASIGFVFIVFIFILIGIVTWLEIHSLSQFKAWSQNLGHEKVLTTFLSYGEVACQRQGEIIRDLAKPQEGRQKDVDKIVKTLLKEFIKSGNELGG